jgi:hypothetical protein
MVYDTPLFDNFTVPLLVAGGHWTPLLNAKKLAKHGVLNTFLDLLDGIYFSRHTYQMYLLQSGL